jgi:hypothetical protein
MRARLVLVPPAAALIRASGSPAHGRRHRRARHPGADPPRTPGNVTGSAPVGRVGGTHGCNRCSPPRSASRSTVLGLKRRRVLQLEEVTRHHDARRALGGPVRMTSRSVRAAVLSDRARATSSSLSFGRLTSAGSRSVAVIGPSRVRAAFAAARCRRRSSFACSCLAWITSRCCSSVSVSCGSVVQTDSSRQ